MTAPTKLILLLAATLTMPVTVFVHAQVPPNWPPKPLELTADPQVITTEAPKTLADQRLKLAYIPWGSEPALEKQRQANEANEANSSIKIDTNFDGSYAIRVHRISPTRCTIDNLGGELYMFYFRVTGVAGKTVRFDILNIPEQSFLKTLTLNPVFTEDLSPDEIPTIGNEAPFTAKTTTVTNGGIATIQLPDTSSQSWHFIEDVWADHEHHTLSFVHTFTKDTAYIAMKYPYFRGLNEKYFDQWAKSPHATVITPATLDTKHQPLRIIRITDLPEDQWKNHPSVVIYGREHANEHDPSWACKGAIDFLLGDSPEAKNLRKNVIFHIIPLLDPVAATSGLHSVIIQGFSKRSAPYTHSENFAYADYFQQWIDAGGRADLVLNLHNVESAERTYHLSVAQTEPQEARFGLSAAFDNLLVGSLRQQGFRASAEGDTGYLPARLSGWLDDTFGALPIAYELNSQEPHRHLLLSELTAMGATLAKSAGDFLLSAQGKELHDTVDAVLDARKVAKAAVTLEDNATVFEKEYKLKEWRAQH